MTIPSRGRVLGVDLGARRVGVAVCDDDQRLATAVATVARTADPGAHRRALARLATEYEAVGAVVGLPRSLSGAEGPAARSARTEARAIGNELRLPVDTVDERLTTVAAASGLRAAGRRAREQRASIDAVAAAGLLQTWLDRRAAAPAARIGPP